MGWGDGHGHGRAHGINQHKKGRKERTAALDFLLNMIYFQFSMAQSASLRSQSGVSTYRRRKGVADMDTLHISTHAHTRGRRSWNKFVWPQILGGVDRFLGRTNRGLARASCVRSGRQASDYLGLGVKHPEADALVSASGEVLVGCCSLAQQRTHGHNGLLLETVARK